MLGGHAGEVNRFQPNVVRTGLANYERANDVELLVMPNRDRHGCPQSARRTNLQPAESAAYKLAPKDEVAVYPARSALLVSHAPISTSGVPISACLLYTSDAADE